MTVLQDLWVKIVWTARILFASRISVLSAAFGILLLSQVDQAQNMFADTSWHSDRVLEIAYWLVFYLATILVWAFPIHYGARRVLDDDAWMLTRRIRLKLDPIERQHFNHQARVEHRLAVLYVPRLLGLLPFVAILFALHGARRAIDHAAPLPEAATAMKLLSVLTSADVVAAIAFYVMVATRRSWSRALARKCDEAGLRRGKFGVGDRMLDLAAQASLVFSMLLVLAAYLEPVAISFWVPRAALVPFLMGTLVLPFSLLARWSHRTGMPLVAAWVGICLLVTGLNVHFNDLRVLRSPGPWPVAARQLDLDAAVARWARANSCVVDPAAARPCPPALIVAAEGGASRAAFAEATIVGTLLDRTPGFGDPPDATSPARRIFAISGVSGGAFGAATIQAALSDAMLKGNVPPCRYAPRTWYRSTEHVDGTPFTWRECLQALTSGDYLSTAIVGIAFRDNFAPPIDLLHQDWVLHDRAALLEQSWERHYDYVLNSGATAFSLGSVCDATSEAGLCRRFGYLTEHPVLKAQDNAWLPLLLLNGTSVQTGRRIITSDLVSTVASPDRTSRDGLYSQAYDLFEAMSTDCASKDVKDQTCTAAPPKGLDRPELRDGPDLRLSTAALTSARFPVISPAGAIYAKGDATFGDRIVDGGFFENSGISTSLDIANALQARHVVPLILWILNEPQRDLTTSVFVPARPTVTPLIGLAESRSLTARVFGLLGAPIGTLMKTREGHSAEVAALASETINRYSNPDRGHRPGFFKIGVFADPDLTTPTAQDPVPPTADEVEHCSGIWGKRLDMPEVSMSWWLSPTIQADLDAQLCGKDNRVQFRTLLNRLSSRAPFQVK